MAFEQRDMSGILFPNDKGDNDKRPDVRGEAMINGQVYRVSGWQKMGQKGPFISLAFDPQQQAAPPAGGNADPFFGGAQPPAMPSNPNAPQPPPGFPAAPPADPAVGGEDIPF